MVKNGKSASHTLPRELSDKLKEHAEARYTTVPGFVKFLYEFWLNKESK